MYCVYVLTNRQQLRLWHTVKPSRKVIFSLFLSLSPLPGWSEEWYSFLQGHRRAGPLFSERDHRSSADGVSLLWKQQLQGLVWSSVGQQQIPGLHLQGRQGVSEFTMQGSASYEMQRIREEKIESSMNDRWVDFESKKVKQYVREEEQRDAGRKRMISR